ncbi:MAG: hypothetical protein IJ358_01785 [Clostridia bacterium]|nr:hypothetical protein [Clostridia bacterium]
MEKGLKQKVYKIINEIEWIEEVVHVSNEYSIDKERAYEFLHNRLNELVKELKLLKVALHFERVEALQVLKNVLWCGCSAKYQQDFMKNKESNSYQY